MSYAKMRAEIGTIAVGASKVKIVLSISKKDFFKNAAFFEGEPEEVMVAMGDPQMSFSFDDHEMQQPQPKPGLTYNVAPNGTVENVKKPEDEEQGDLLDQESEDAPFDAESEGDEEKVDFDDLSFDDEETEAGEEESDPDESEDEDEPEDSDEEPSKEDLEEFILNERPTFPDDPYNFPELLQRKKDGDTWLEIAKDLWEPSTKLQGAWSRYKKQVAKRMKGGAA